MNNVTINRIAGCLSLGLVLAGANAKADESNSISDSDAPGVVYTMDNASGANHVLIFRQDNQGALQATGNVATGGTGTGKNLGLPDESSVVLSHDGRWLFVCNAGSDDISVFSTEHGGLQLVDKVSSGGQMPLSLALHHNLLYVLNAGGLVGDKDNITGFFFADGRLLPLPESTRPLSADNTGPAEVAFTRDGNNLIVTERLTNLIDTFNVGDDGTIIGYQPQTFNSSGIDPFGFAVSRNNQVLVSEAHPGVNNGSTASAYSISDHGDLKVISASVPTLQSAACWLALTPDDRFVYTANAASGTLSGFRVGHDGSLSLLEANGIAASIGNGSHPVDLAPSSNSQFLYSLANGNGTLTAFQIAEDGSLKLIGSASGIPATAAGLAAQ
jgi:6-phosphogluconolactonase